jgi:hypothetical protein
MPLALRFVNTYLPHVLGVAGWPMNREWNAPMVKDVVEQAALCLFGA